MRKNDVIALVTVLVSITIGVFVLFANIPSDDLNSEKGIIPDIAQEAEKSQTPIVEKESSSKLVERDYEFEKKQECEKYRPSIEKRLENSYYENKNTGAQIFYNLDRIFFSKKLNTCLYISTDQMYVNGKLKWETPSITDALTSEILISALREVGTDTYFTRKAYFESHIKDYE